MLLTTFFGGATIFFTEIFIFFGAKHLRFFNVKCPIWGNWWHPFPNVADFYRHCCCFYLLFGTISAAVIRISPKFLFVFEKNTCENRVFSHRLVHFSVIRAIWGNWWRPFPNVADFYRHRCCFYCKYVIITRKRKYIPYQKAFGWEKGRPSLMIQTSKGVIS